MSNSKLETFNVNRHSSTKKFFIFFFFVLVLGTIFLTTIYDGNITGNFFKNPDMANNSILISLETNIPDFSLEGNYPSIEFNVSSNQKFILEGKEFFLNRFSNSIIIKDFSGKINFNENSIKTLNGKASEISINGVIIKNNDNKKIKISLPENFTYNSVEFQGELFLSELKYNSTGNIEVSNNKINLLEDEIFIQNLFGYFSFVEEKMIFEGIVSKVEIKGPSKSIILSK